MLFYKTYTEGATDEWVVLVHGAGGSSSIWFKQLREYIKHFNVLLIDLRGHGRSGHTVNEPGKQNYSFNDVSRDIIEVMDHLRIKSAHFVGISLGTIIIRTIGELDKSRLRSMILGGAVTRLNVRSRILVFGAKVLKKHIPFMWLYSICAHVLMPKKRHRESRNMFIEDAKRLAQTEFLRWFKLTAEVNPLLRYFTEKEISVPTLYLMGDEDYMFLPAVKNLVRRHTYSVLRIISDSGHVCNVDQPDSFNDISVDFIYKVSDSDRNEFIQEYRQLPWEENKTTE